MRLAEEITVFIAGEPVELRPTLRDAIRLERRPGGFAKLIAEIDDLSLSTMAELIDLHDPHPLTINRVHDAGLATLQPAVLAYVYALTGLNPDAAKGPAKGRTVPMSEHLAELYRIGTGWLSWDPEVTLDASPAEIVEAFAGRMAMLKAIFGTGKDDKPKDDRPLDEKVRSLFAGRTTKVAA